MGKWGGLAVLLLAGAPALAQDSSTLSWGHNTFGMPGMVEMPQAFSREDAEVGVHVSHFARQTRIALTFQISQRLSGAFRYSMLYDVTGTVTPDYFDRSFALHFRFMDEGKYLPAMAVGINDIVGTGLYAGEYVVASKTLTPRLRASAGIGWGRLGSRGGFTNPLGVISDGFKTRPFNWNTAGDFDPGAWFHGDAALFGGVEWLVNDRLRFAVEYSSDDYTSFDGSTFDNRSPLNFGLSWKYTENTTLSANYLYGSTLAVQFDYTMNPKRSAFGSGREAGPLPIVPRNRAAAATWGEIGVGTFESRLRAGLQAEGLTLDGMEVAGRKVSIGIRNSRYGTAAQALGRAARALSRTAPAEAETFGIVLTDNGMPVTAVTLRRADLEELEFHPVAPDLLRSRTRIADETERLPRTDASYPAFSYGLGPYIRPGFFDPDSPMRVDFGLSLNGRYEPLPGLVFSGKIQQKLFGNLDQTQRQESSVLPHVRTSAFRYSREADVAITDLTVAYYFRPGADLFGRVTAGYLEGMYGGVSGEVLWKPQNSALAFGIEMNYVRQRDYDQMFGFRDYEVATGHASAYYEFGKDFLLGPGFMAQLDVGRYLAGDVGATLSVAREFDNGWKLGVFATLTDVSAEEFGEGSFDKGITLTIPLSWQSGQASQTKLSTTIRPVQRDGGARVFVPGRLYERVRGLQATELDASWGRFWR